MLINASIKYKGLRKAPFEMFRFFLIGLLRILFGTNYMQIHHHNMETYHKIGLSGLCLCLYLLHERAEWKGGEE